MKDLKKVFNLENSLWCSNILNAVGLGFQLATLIQTHIASGLSLPMFVIFLYAQINLTVKGYRIKSGGQFWGMLASAIITTITIVLIMLYR